MISLKRKDGTEVDIQTCNNPAEVERMLTKLLQPETYARLKKELAAGGEEIFFEFTGANKEEMPRVRHYLVHLDTLPQSIGNLSRGNFYIAFYVHKDSLPLAQGNGQMLKSNFKNTNDWNETTEHGIPQENFFQIPPIDLK